jgi:hypothetical protein
MKRESMSPREKQSFDMREPRKRREKTEMEKLMSGLANVRRRSGDMQKLATQEVYYLRKIVVLLQLQQRYRMDTVNIQARKIRKLQRLNDLQRACIDAMNATVAEKPVPSHVPGLDL